jgi:outer membrane protein OmpA-like peptidoglycan-associated protein
MSKTLRISMISLFLLCLQVGCAEMTTTQRSTSLGAGLGALSGAVVGQIVGGDTKATLIGAAAGTAIGTGVGYGIGNYMTKQEAAMRAAFDGVDGVFIARDEDNLIVTLNSSSQFEVGSAALKPDGQSAVLSLARVLTQYPETRISIYGHTDSTGSDATNLQLSMARAQSVSRAMEYSQVAPARLETTGLGSQFPVADNATTAGRALNRRIEILIKPIEK